jgi:hypothetical protein
MNQRELKAYIAELRKIEDDYYREVLGDAELYIVGIRLVRAIADTLRSLTTVQRLITRFKRTGSDYVGPIAETLNTPRALFINYQKALGAAFYLRMQELEEDQARSAWLQRVTEASGHAAGWIVVYDLEQQRYGRKFAHRLEMHVPEGLSIRTWSDLDWEKGLIYIVEPLLLDPLTGKPRHDAKLTETSQEFTTPAEMRAAAQALKTKLSTYTEKTYGGSDSPQVQSLSRLGQTDAAVTNPVRPKRRAASVRGHGNRRQQTPAGRSQPADRRRQPRGR